MVVSPDASSASTQLVRLLRFDGLCQFLQERVPFPAVLLGEERTPLYFTSLSAPLSKTLFKTLSLLEPITLEELDDKTPLLDSSPTYSQHWIIISTHTILSTLYP